MTRLTSLPSPAGPAATFAPRAALPRVGTGMVTMVGMVQIQTMPTAPWSSGPPYLLAPSLAPCGGVDLIAAAREAAEAGFDLLIACAFSYDAHATELTRIGALPVLKARMNADLHMADTLKNDSRGNLFVIFGEPDIELQEADDDMVRVQIRGVDIFNPATGQVRSDDTDGIACWFVDTDYNEESFFVRQAYFLGASSDPYRSLKTTLKAEIDADAWATLNSDVSRPFPKPQSGRIAVKVINHLGDEAMKVLTVGWGGGQEGWSRIRANICYGRV